MSLYISVSSGQYLQHLTFRKHKENEDLGFGFGVFFFFLNFPNDGVQFIVYDLYTKGKLYTQDQGLFF